MTLVLILIALVLAGVVLWLSTREGDYHVRRQIIIKAPPEGVFDKLRDFPSWRDWSPWLMHEPEAELTFSDHPDQVDGWYTWNGRYIGAGKLTHTRLESPRRIEQRLEFVKPFKSVSTVWWELEPHEGGTEVTWNMQARMPFLLRFMTAMMKQMIARDFDLGLAMLAGELDPGSPRPRISFAGRTHFPASSTISTSFAGGIADMENAMRSGFAELFAHARDQGVEPTGAALTAYHKVDIKSMYFECDIALPLSLDADAGAFERKTLGGGDYYEVVLKGSYDYLELTWYSAMGHLRMYKVKQDSSRPSFEVYEVGPIQADDAADYVTRLLIPVK